MVFDSRQHAGQLLAQELRRRRLKPGLVLGLARGGIVVAAEIAHAFRLPLQALIVRKISAPGEPEFAIGAIAAIPDGKKSLVFSIWWEQDAVRRLRLTDNWKKQQIEDKKIEISNYVSQVSGIEKIARLDNKFGNLILVDDGAATGGTMLAAIGAVRKASQGLSLAPTFAYHSPLGTIRSRLMARSSAGKYAKESPYKTKVIVALPVASSDATEKIKHRADETIVLFVDPDFRAVGQYYRSFEQVSWEEIRRILKKSRSRTE